VNRLRSAAGASYSESAEKIPKPQPCRISIHLCKQISVKAQAEDRTRASDLLVVEGLFITATNVNFDPQNIAAVIRRGAPLAGFAPAADLDALIKQGEAVVAIHSTLDTFFALPGRAGYG